MTRNEMIARYIAGDLDRVELRRFEAKLEESSALRAELAEGYDARTADEGLFALCPGDPDFKYCFSVATLERYARGKLSTEDGAIVESHLACPFCAQQLEFLRRDPRVVPTGPWASYAKFSAVGLVAATAIMGLVAFPTTTGTKLRGEPWPACLSLSVRATKAAVENNCADTKVQIGLVRIDGPRIDWIAPPWPAPAKAPRLPPLAQGMRFEAEIPTGDGAFVLFAVDGSPSAWSVESSLQRWSREGGDLDLGGPTAHVRRPVPAPTQRATRPAVPSTSGSPKGSPTL